MMTVSKIRIAASITALSAAITAVPANAEIRFDPSTRMFRLSGGNVEYDIGIDKQDYLQPVYWGKILDRTAPLALPALPAPPVLASHDIPSSVVAQEYAGQGGGIVAEPGIKVIFADGNRDLVLKYHSHKISGDTLTIELEDISRPLAVTLRYSVDPVTGIVGRSAVARNNGTSLVHIDQIASATMTLPYQPHYRLSYLAGRQQAEFGLEQQSIGRALAVLESRRGATSNHMSPWFAVDREDISSEE